LNVDVIQIIWDLVPIQKLFGATKSFGILTKAYWNFFSEEGV
jgi:hypothetical protein